MSAPPSDGYEAANGRLLHGRAPAWGTDAAPRRAGRPCRSLSRSHRTTRRPAPPESWNCIFGRSPGPPPGSFQDAASAARMRDASSRAASPPAAGRRPSGRRGARGAPRPSRAPTPRFADRRRCCPCPRLCQWYAAPERRRRPIAAPPCASSRRCMTAPAPWLPRWGNSCAPAGAASCGC